MKGSGRQRGITEQYRGATLTNFLRPKVKLECVVADTDCDLIVDTVLRHARTGNVGDGKVFVLPVQEAYRVRTGEAGEHVLQAHRARTPRHDRHPRGARQVPTRHQRRGGQPPGRRSPTTTSSRWFGLAADRLGLADDLRAVLQSSYREVQVQVPVKLSDGRIHVYSGFRVQHTGARGPYKGGVRYHPEVDLERCARSPRS